MKKIKYILPSVLNRYSLSDASVSSFVIEEFKKFFVENWSVEDWQEIQSIKFKNASLVICVSSATWANQIFIHKEEILEYIKKSLENIKINSLICKIT